MGDEISSDGEHSEAPRSGEKPLADAAGPSSPAATATGQPSGGSTAPRPVMHNELWRHSIIVLPLIAVLGVLLLGALSIGLLDQGGSTVLALSFTIFGLYGPAFLLLTHIAFRRSKGGALRKVLRRRRQRSTLVRFLMLGGPRMWAVVIAALGLSSVLFLSLDAQLRAHVDVVVGCVICLAGSWVLLAAVFAVEYMRLWGRGDGIDFPGGDQQLSFADFFYLSVQLSTTFSSSDVNLTTTEARRMATSHSIAAFAYSTVIIGVFASMVAAAAG